jgi:hypothetical protein
MAALHNLANLYFLILTGEDEKDWRAATKAIHTVMSIGFYSVI